MECLPEDAMSFEWAHYRKERAFWSNLGGKRQSLLNGLIR